ncbi:MAG: hypothetical protein IBX71_01175 [Candidatus Desulforudis sp.]|nr:hypothetical protein [Desulforudis sp.]
MLLGLLFVFIVVFQLWFQARIIESRRGRWGRDRELTRPERFGCFNVLISLLIGGDGRRPVWWALVGSRFS